MDGNAKKLRRLDGVRRLGKYELIAKIGEGGMARVFLARQRGPLGFQKVVVVKEVLEQHSQNPQFLKMLHEEARIAARLKHRNVVDTYELGEDNGHHFIAMEYIQGQTLSQILGRSKRKRTYLDVYSVAWVIAEVAAALEAAHNLVSLSGRSLAMVHRDVSPGNIMVTYSGSVKLLDFGVALPVEDTATEQGALKGKIPYMSPEQLAREPLDRRTDVFSLAIVFWEALTVGRLFRGDHATVVNRILKERVRPPSEFRPGVPFELDEICLRAMAKDRDSRYQTAGQMRKAIVDFLRQSNYYDSKGVLTRHLETQFGADMRAERELVREVLAAEEEFSVPRPVRDDLSAPVSIATRQKSGLKQLPSLPHATLPAELAVSGSITEGELEEPSVASDELEESPWPDPAAAAALPGPVLPPQNDAGFDLVAEARRRKWLTLLIAFGVFVMIGVIAGALGDGGDGKPAEVAATTVLDQPDIGGGGAEADDELEPAAVDPADEAAADEAAADEAVADPVDEAAADEAFGDEAAPDEAFGDEPPADEAAADEPPADEPAARRRAAARGTAAKPSRKSAAPRPEPKPARAQRGKRDRRAAHSYYRAGLSRLYRGDTRSAESLFFKALAAAPGYSPAYKGLGHVHRRRGNRSKAIKYFRRYLRASPKAKDRKKIQKTIRSLGG